MPPSQEAVGFLPETDDTAHLEVYREALASGISGETAAGNRLLRILFMRPHRVPELSHGLLQAVALVLLTTSDPPVELQGLFP